MQKRASRFVTGNYSYETGSMSGILGRLKWESLKKRRKNNRLILLYKGLKGKASVPTDELIPKTRHCRNQHSMAFQTPIANTDVYKGSFFPQTIRGEYCVAKPYRDILRYGESVSRYVLNMYWIASKVPSSHQRSPYIAIRGFCIGIRIEYVLDSK